VFTGNFEADYRAIQTALEQKRKFAFVRFGDGEWTLLKGRPYKSASGWTTKGSVWLEGELMRSLCANLDSYCVGYSPPCCHPKCVGFYADNMSVPKLRRTYSTVFFHGNFGRAKAFFSKLDAVKVGCTRDCAIRVPADAVNNPVDLDDILQKMLEVRDRPILVAAGPLACILVHRYWNWTKKRPEDRVACLDIGALLDEKSHGKRTRHYHDPKSPLLRHYCNFSNWEPARQRQVVGIHNAVTGRFVRDVRAPNSMKSPMEQVAARREAGQKPGWLTKRPKIKRK
jgi:hypothetical protein